MMQSVFEVSVDGVREYSHASLRVNHQTLHILTTHDTGRSPDVVDDSYLLDKGKEVGGRGRGGGIIFIMISSKG